MQSRVFIDFIDGRLCYRHVFHQESWGQNDLSVADTRYGFQPRGALGTVTPVSFGSLRIETSSTREELAVQAVATAFATADNRERMRRSFNAFSQRLNRRIAAVLTETTGQEGFASVHDWWSWWDADNGIAYPERPTSTRYVATNITLAGSASGGSAGGSLAVPAECFAAGTPVWTALGPRTIEKIKVGDLVLSQDVESGELGFKPVLLTTTRPEEELVRINVGEDLLETTDGHPFWVSGRGWVLARKLAKNMTLYALDAAPKVDATATGSKRKTYNLVVADFHTYFAGKSRVLVHDNTRQRATNAIVPGLY